MTSEEQTALGARIRLLRERCGMTLGDLERASGVTKGYLSQLEAGKATNPSLDAVRKIAQGLGLRISDLLDEAEIAEPSRQDLPPGLRAFLEEAESRGVRVNTEDVDMLLGIRYRGRRPETAEDWALLYDLIKRIVG